MRNEISDKSIYGDTNKELDKIKKWFDNNMHIINIAFDYWYDTEKDKMDIFYKKINTSFLKILNGL